MRHIRTIIILLIGSFFSISLLILFIEIAMGDVSKYSLVGIFVLWITSLIIGIMNVWWHILIAVILMMLFTNIKKKWLIIVIYIYVFLIGLTSCIITG
ncbi:hypothetical protein D5430_05270, partial [Salmonella enterica]|nr:hypothetical protein [Salmonella enterica]EAU4770348.1 hypothetical protein [Salmonella enterica]EBC9909917.1 hypothetical protein [Salmonella enterica subsp. enterica serovar Senftenberg]MKN90617.1 hypothetical protein [Salmonella enterica]